jgi:DNA-binding CsgD family transcriptional regulator
VSVESRFIKPASILDYGVERVMAESKSRIIGRAGEVAEIAAFLDTTPDGISALRIEGEAGVGKTTLWLEALRAARDGGWRVLSASASEQETKLAFAVLGDLLGDAVDEVAEQLASPQRRAIEVALLRAEFEGVRPDRRAVGLAVVETIRHLAGANRVLLAIDDVQWLDASSAQALAFAIRRMQVESVAVIATLRVARGLRDPLELHRALAAENLRRLAVGPLDQTALRSLFRGRLETGISSSLSRRLHEASGGNPFFALELARVVQREGREPVAGDPLPLPRDLAKILGSRLRLLSEDARDLLLIVAAAGRPSPQLVRKLGSSQEAASAALDEAERNEVIETIADRVRFVHPLLGSTVYEQAGTDRRREAHLRLSEVVDDPIERAWHLALGTRGADPNVAAALDQAASVAESRGAPAIAAELAELAQRLTPSEDPDAAQMRALVAAELLFEAGDLDRAIAQMDELIALAPPGPMKAEVLHRLSNLYWQDVRRVRELVELALQEAGPGASPILLINLHRAMGAVELWGAGDSRLAIDYFDHSLALAETLGDPVEIALCLNMQAWVAFISGRPDAMELIRRAISLAERRGFLMHLVHPRRTLGLLLLWTGDLDQARIELERDYRQIVEGGHLGVLWTNLSHLCELEVRAGNWVLAERYAAEGLDVAIDVLQEQAREVCLWSSGLVAAHRGRVDLARAHAREGLLLAEQHEDLWYVLCNGSVLGFLELSLGNAAGADEHLAPLVNLAERMGLEEPGIFPFVPDEIEALIALGELDRAEALLQRLEGQAKALDRAFALASVARCRSLLAAATGDLDGASRAVEEAVEHHGRVPQPFDLARTLLVQGQIQRRQKHKRPAREALQQALEAFERLGAPIWAEKARAELGRIGGRAASPLELTPTERRVASLLADGLSNREIADRLFVSVRTVEGHLSSAYRKLGVRSRTELASKLGAQTTPGDAHIAPA